MIKNLYMIYVKKYYEILDLNCGPLYQFIALNNLNGFGIDYKTYIYCKKNKLELINNDLVNNALCIYGINKNTGKYIMIVQYIIILL